LAGFHFPASLRSFWIPSGFNHPLEGLDFSRCHQLTAILFEGGNNLAPTTKFNFPIERWKLPHSLTRLDLEGAYAFDQPIARLQLPPRLRYLTLPKSLRHSVADMHLPPSLRVLSYSVICTMAPVYQAMMRRAAPGRSSRITRSSSAKSSSSSSSSSNQPRRSSRRSAGRTGSQSQHESESHTEDSGNGSTSTSTTTGPCLIFDSSGHECEVEFDPFLGRRLPSSIIIERSVTFDMYRRSR